MLKPLAISVTILCAGLGTASAGGYIAPVIAPVIKAPRVDPAIRNWEGLYLGGAIGYAFGADDRVGITPPGGGLVHTPGAVDISGMTWSLHLGYRWQREARGRQVVMGPELVYEGGNARDSLGSNGASASSELDRLLSLRWKTGLLNKAQDTLFYGTIGMRTASSIMRSTGPE
ncbi:hypothetical protein [Paracoccus pantotrophus]|uniref:hypothetical protein n=1 Tax=Paracoccus pantotrophus TaxID=82367 RepID=UPI001622505A|nr:hypothetical protein [Paracoccus pantotrophus]